MDNFPSTDGRRVLYQKEETPGGNTNMWVWDSRNPGPGQQQVTASSNYDSNGTIDGDLACFARANETDDIYCTLLSTGEEVRVTDDLLTMETNPEVFGRTVMFQAIGGGNKDYRGPGDPLALYMADIPPSTIPAVSEWGMLALTLLTLLAGTLIYRHRNPLAEPR